MRWEWIKQTYDGDSGMVEQRQEPPRLLASTEEAQSLGIPRVIKVLNSCSGMCLLCEVCCYIFAALTTRIFQIVPFVITNCLWSSTVWVDAVYRITWTKQPTPQRNTCFTLFQCHFCKTTQYVNLFGRKGEEKGHYSI